jgi:hypothetical protein
MTEAKDAPLVEQLKAREVYRAAELKHVRLRGCIVRQQLRAGPLPEQVKLGERVQVGFGPENRFLSVEIELTLLARYKDMPADTRPEDAALFISASYQLVYWLESAVDLDERQLAAFGEQIGLFNVWPYWREFVSSMTNRLEIQAFYVPLLSLVHPMERVLTRVLEHGLWNAAMPISSLRETLKHVDPHIIRQSANLPEVIEHLLSLSDENLERLIDRLILQKRFPDANS